MRAISSRTAAILSLALVLVLISATVAAARPSAQGTGSENTPPEAGVAAAAPLAVVGPDVQGYQGPAVAGSPASAASEPGAAPLADAAAAAQPAALLPDDEGYQGPASEAASVAISSEEANNPWAESLAVPAGAADESVATAAGVDAWSGLRYIFVAGSALTPRGSATQWSYPGFGCVSVTSGSELLTAAVNLPPGSRVDYLRAYYYDKVTPANSEAFLTIYDGSGNVADVSTVESAGNAGYGTTLSEFSGHLVDASKYAYSLNWRPAELSANMRLCGLRIAYRLPS